MTYGQALAAAKNGSMILRTDWLNPLRYTGGKLEFVKAVQMYGKVRDRSYDPTSLDRESHDWQCA